MSVRPPLSPVRCQCSAVHATLPARLCAAVLRDLVVGDFSSYMILLKNVHVFFTII